MTKDELFERVQEYLKSEEIGFEADSKACICSVGLDGEKANVSCKLVCADEPLLIHAFATIPIRVPQEANSRVALGLHDMNTYCKLGGFVLDREEHRVFFKTSLPLEGVVEVSEAIRVVMGVSLHTMDQAAHDVMKLIFDASQGDATEDCPLPARGTSPLQAPDGQRPGFN